MTRDELQAQCLEYPKDASIALNWSPRVGKTRGAINCLNGENVLIVSNSELIRDDWKISMKDYKGYFTSICYQSLKNAQTIWHTIILDEFDLCTDNYYELIKELGAKRYIFLTGTPTFRSNQFMAKLAPKVIKSTVTMDQAIAWGILPVPKITCLGLTLRTDKQECLFQIGKNQKNPVKYAKYGEHFQHLKTKGIRLHVQCTEVEWYGLINAEIDYWNTIVQNYRKLDNFEQLNDKGEEYKELKKIVSNYRVPKEMALNVLKQSGLKRKNFLADKKNRYIERLFKFFKVENERVIVFANSIPQAEFINEDCVMHSKLKVKKGEKNPLDKFNYKIINTLVSVGQLERGVAVREVHTSFILQIPGSDASAMQKASRNLLDDTPRLVLVYFRGTKDEDNVKKFVNKFNPDYIEWVNVANTK